MTSGYALFPKHPASEMTFYILFHNFIHIQFMKSSRRRNISRPLHDRTSVFPRKYRKYLIKLPPDLVRPDLGAGPRRSREPPRQTPAPLPCRML